MKLSLLSLLMRLEDNVHPILFHLAFLRTCPSAKNLRYLEQ